MEKIFKLSQEYIDCLDEIEYSREHLFITGKAGTGKSTLLDLFRRTTSKNVVILAPTGIAALKVHGQTIHSFFKFPPRLILPSDIKYTPSLKRIVNKLEILILDEISMVRADILDGINKILQLHRNNNKPFGGIRLVAFGDIYQLPPIVSSAEERHFFQNNYTSAYFFASEIWQQLNNMRYINLSKVYRQTDRSFIRLLDEIRMGDIDYDSLTALNENVDPDFDQEGYIYLSPRNATMQRINQQKLAELPNEERTYLPTITGE
ncbi:MAG TPA: AAA family ATPase [Saprospiraceae bacterium]|nr:AAA family ATPase [Saprospiraceae bacterium]